MFFVFFWRGGKHKWWIDSLMDCACTVCVYRLNWSADEARRSLPLLSLDNTALKNSCPESITCPSAATLKYRPIDGSCHNLVRPDWGKANTPFQRALPNAYADGSFVRFFPPCCMLFVTFGKQTAPLVMNWSPACLTVHNDRFNLISCVHVFCCAIQGFLNRGILPPSSKVHEPSALRSSSRA